MPFVLDASVVGCWCFQDENDARADAAWDLLERDRESALVPLHWWFEIRNVALHGERRGRLTEDYNVSLSFGSWNVSRSIMRPCPTTPLC